MNIVILGPFGYGSLADEAVLAGLLKRLLATGRGTGNPTVASGTPPKHNVTVLSADPEKTAAIHDAHAVALANPGSVVSTPDAWEALTQAHLLVAAGGGVLGAQGKTPSRVWLSAVEHAHRVGVKTAVVGVGAREIAEPRERIRLQRLLHNFTDSTSTRDAESKGTLVSYGLSPNRVSNNGDPALALAAGEIVYAPRERVGLVVAEAVPSRETFGPEGRRVFQPLLQATRTLVADLDCEVIVFHDDTDSARECVARLRDGLPAERVSALAADCPLARIRAEMAACQVVFSQTLHGLLLAAGCGVPVVGLSAEPGAEAFLKFLGCADCALPPQESAFDAALASARLRELLARAPEVSRLVRQRVAILARKEAQNARMLEFLVPRRERFAKRASRQHSTAEDE